MWDVGKESITIILFWVRLKKNLLLVFVPPQIVDLLCCALVNVNHWHVKFCVILDFVIGDCQNTKPWRP